MIIKSMSRKEPSFGQLLQYVSRDASDRRYELRHNLLGTDIGTLTAEYQDNARLLPERKNGVVMYHEIISITRARKLGLDAQKEVLRSIALDYLRQRAPESLAYGVLHEDKADQLHYHLVISANGLGRKSRHRLDRKKFRQIQVGLEARVLALHPELEQVLSIGKKAKPRQLSQPGVELQRRTGNTPQKQALATCVAAIFAAAQDKQDLFNRLTDARLELYRRGNTIGIRDLDKGRNHRLATLGLAAEFKAMSARLDADRPQTTLGQSAKQPGPTRPPPSRSPTPAARQEDQMNILDAVVSGIGAVVDTLSIHRDLGQPLDEHKRKVVVAVNKATDHSAHPALPTELQSTAPLSETDRIAQERAREMEAIREDQARQRGNEDASQLKR